MGPVASGSKKSPRDRWCSSGSGREVFYVSPRTDNIYAQARRYLRTAQKKKQEAHLPLAVVVAPSGITVNSAYREDKIRRTKVNRSARLSQGSPRASFSLKLISTLATYMEASNSHRSEARQTAKSSGFDSLSWGVSPENECGHDRLGMFFY